MQEAQRAYAERLLSGSFKTLEDYKHVAGKLKGHEEAEYIFREIYKNLFDVKEIKDKREPGQDEQE